MPSFAVSGYCAREDRRQTRATRDHARCVPRLPYFYWACDIKTADATDSIEELRRSDKDLNRTIPRLMDAQQ